MCPRAGVMANRHRRDLIHGVASLNPAVGALSVEL
jgi:hypothetical protein